MSSENESKSKTVPWNCSRCGCPIELPHDLENPGAKITCPKCGAVSRLVVKTFPMTCQVCGNLFSVPKSTTVLGGDVWCPVCNAHYRRNKRPLMKDTCQKYGRLILVNKGRK